jgi:hypothetical protein
MKKTIIILALAALFAACDKTKNEQGIIDLFIGDEEILSSPGLTNYNAIEYLDYVNETVSNWTEDESAYLSITRTGGYLVFTGKRDCYVWHNISLDNRQDFQFEINMQLAFSNTNYNKRMGMIFGQSGESYNFFTITQLSDSWTVSGGHNDNGTVTKWFEKEITFNASAEHLFTLRKIGNKMSFFLDKTYLHAANYDGFAANYGVVLPKSGVVKVQTIKIDYILETND